MYLLKHVIIIRNISKELENNSNYFSLGIQHSIGNIKKNTIQLYPNKLKANYEIL